MMPLFSMLAFQAETFIAPNLGWWPREWHKASDLVLPTALIWTALFSTSVREMGITANTS
jgi:hypothetical protein